LCGYSGNGASQPLNTTAVFSLKIKVGGNRSRPDQRRLQASERQSCLEFDHPTGQTIRRTAKLIRVYYVRRRRRWYKWRQVQYIENIEKICSEGQLRPLAQERGSWNAEVFSERHVNRCVTRSFENIAATAARSPSGNVK